MPAPKFRGPETKEGRPETTVPAFPLSFGQPTTKIQKAPTRLAKAPVRPLMAPDELAPAVNQLAPTPVHLAPAPIRLLRALNELAPLAGELAPSQLRSLPSENRSPPYRTLFGKIQAEVESAFFISWGRFGMSRKAASNTAKPANRLGFAGFSFAKRRSTTPVCSAPLHCGRSANRCRTRAISCRLGRRRRAASRRGRVEYPLGDPISSRPI